MGFGVKVGVALGLAFVVLGSVVLPSERTAGLVTLVGGACFAAGVYLAWWDAKVADRQRRRRPSGPVQSAETVTSRRVSL